LAIYEILKEQGLVATAAIDNLVRTRLRIKKGKSHSGVLDTTVFTSPYPEYVDSKGNTQNMLLHANGIVHIAQMSLGSLAALERVSPVFPGQKKTRLNLVA
jgi:hypothetical protein